MWCDYMASVWEAYSEAPYTLMRFPLMLILMISTLAYSLPFIRTTSGGINDTLHEMG